MSVLLGDAPLPDLDLAPPTDSAVQSILDTGRTHAQYWRSLRLFGRQKHICAESAFKFAELAFLLLEIDFVVVIVQVRV